MLILQVNSKNTQKLFKYFVFHFFIISAIKLSYDKKIKIKLIADVINITC